MQSGTAVVGQPFAGNASGYAFGGYTAGSSTFGTPNIMWQSSSSASTYAPASMALNG